LQLKDYWARDVRLRDLKPAEFHVAQRSERYPFDVPRPIQGIQNFFFRFPCSGIDFVPLAIRIRYMDCQLAIGWLRNDPPGEILSVGGDMDNRLKTLFDALRMPHDPGELPKNCAHEGPFFCLLEDDSMISKLTIETAQIFGGAEQGLQENDVDLDLAVTIRPRYPMIANTELLFP
jgi:hypothetical protein